MILALIGIIVAIIGVGGGIYVSKRNFDRKISQVTVISDQHELDTTELQEQLDRIEELRNNLIEVRRNVEYLDIPTPESVSSYDDGTSTLNKLSQFYEEHNLAIAGAEQFILSLLPTSQIGQSLHAIAECLPKQLGQAIFGDSIHTLSDSMTSAFTSEGLGKFIHGMTHLSRAQQLSMMKHLEHHNWGGAVLTPVKSGAMEVSGVHDAAHDLTNSLHQISADITSSMEGCTSIGDLTDVTDVDITGHIPVITIALSSYREFQLLDQDKTDYIRSIENIALDAAGTGLGAAGGAKAGALAGSIFGPPGAVIGGILGAIGGGIAGRKITNEIKSRHLKKALALYKDGYEEMKRDTEIKAKSTLSAIDTYATEKRAEFKTSQLLDSIPVVDDEVMLQQSAVAILNCVINEIECMKNGVKSIRRSFWYSEEKHGKIIAEFESEINEIEEQLPPISYLKDNPCEAIDILINLQLPNRKSKDDLQAQINSCTTELKKQNDANDASVLMWSYMVNNLYQSTLNDVADFSNKQMEELNNTFKNWRVKLQSLEKEVETEKNKLGL